MGGSRTTEKPPKTQLNPIKTLLKVVLELLLDVLEVLLELLALSWRSWRSFYRAEGPLGVQKKQSFHHFDGFYSFSRSRTPIGR